MSTWISSHITNVLLQAHSHSLLIKRNGTLQSTMLLSHVSCDWRGSPAVHRGRIEEAHSQRCLFSTTAICTRPAHHLAIVRTIDVEKQSPEGLECAIGNAQCLRSRSRRWRRYFRRMRMERQCADITACCGSAWPLHECWAVKKVDAVQV